MSLTPKQIEERRKGIGASDAGIVVGLSTLLKSPLQLYYEKRGELRISDEETEAIEWGNLLEEPIARRFSRVTGRKVRRQPAKVSTRYAWMRCNVDRQILGDPRGPGLLECKAVNAYQPITDLDSLPDQYYLQIQHQLAVYDYEWAIAAVLIGGQKSVYIPVDRHQGVIDDLIAAEAEFWEGVLAGIPPPLDGSEATRAVLNRMYPRDNGAVITLDSIEAVATVNALELWRAELQKADEQKKTCEAWIKAQMGEASVAKIPGFGTITWKRTKERQHEIVDLVKLRTQFAEAYQACVTTETRDGGRRFLVKPEKDDGKLDHD